LISTTGRRALAGILAASLVFGALRIRSLLGVAAGYAAKVVASGIFVSGRSLDSLLREELAPETPLERRLVKQIAIDFEVDPGAHTVRATIFGLVSREAVCREALGCTLALGRSAAALQKQGDQARSPALAQVDPWTVGERREGGRLAEAVGSAFSKPEQRTRAVIVVQGGAIVAERYASGFGPEMPLPGWSMAKTVTGALLGVLVGRGILDVSASPGLREWDGDARASITLDQLMRMSSGLRFEERYDSLDSDATRMLFGSEDAAAVAVAQPLAVAPGTVWAYSSGTTNILSLVMRRSFPSDREYWRFPREALFDRIGMASAILETDPAGTFVGSSYLHATARDWARFGQLLLQDGVWGGQAILPEGWVRYMVTPAPAAPRGEYGAQTWLNQGDPGDPERRPHPGLPADLFLLAGFQGQRVVVIPSRELVVVRLGLTKDEESWSLETDLMSPILEALDSEVEAVE
jgi:CubicO group peptidase (beta-lactamase class C family)